MAIEVYWGSGSPYSWRVLLALEYKRLAYVSHQLQFSRQEHKSPQILALNFRGRVPILKDGDYVVFESLAVLYYLDLKYPEPPIFGHSPEEAGVIMRVICEYQSYVEEHLMKIVRAVFEGEAQEHIDALADSMHVVAREARSIEGRLSRSEWVVGDTLLRRRHRDIPGAAAAAARPGQASGPRAVLPLPAPGCQLSSTGALDRPRRGSAGVRAYFSTTLAVIMTKHPVYIDFPGRIVFVGFGSIGQGVLPLILRHIGISPDRITIVTADDSGSAEAEHFGVKRIKEALTRDNFRRILAPLLGRGDLLLNVSVDVSSVALIRFSWEKGAMYLDTCIEPWAGGYIDPTLSAARRTNYAMREEALALRAGNQRAPTAVVTHGANPGMVSHLVKQAHAEHRERHRRRCRQSRFARGLGGARQSAGHPRHPYRGARHPGVLPRPRS